MNETLKFILIFSIAQFLNVMLNTIKTIVMYNKNKLSSSLINAITYGFYTVIVVMMAGEMALWLKMVLTALTNFAGVWLSMLILEKVNKKLYKDKLWEITATAKIETDMQARFIHNDCKMANLSFNSTKTNKNDELVLHIYAKTKEESRMARSIIEKYNMKYIIHESELKL